MRSMAMNMCGLVGLLLAVPATAQVSVERSHDAFVAAHAGTVSHFSDIDTQIQSTVQLSAATFSTACSETEACLSSTSSGLFVANPDILRHCSNEIPDPSQSAFQVCIYDHEQGADDGGPMNADVFAVTSASSFLGLTFSSAIGGTRRIDYLVNGTAGTLTFAGSAFVGFSGTGPLTASFSSSNFMRVTELYDGTAAAVPEPASWAMMIAGFGAIGFAMRRRREAAVRVSYAG